MAAYWRHPARSGSPGSRHFSDPPSHHTMPQAMRDLAKILTSSDTTIPPYRDDPQWKLILPCTSKDTKVCLVNHYGDTFARLLRFSPKVMNYQQRVAEKEVTRSEIESIIRETTSTLHKLTEEHHCCTEVNFVKVVFTDPKPPEVRKSDEFSAIDMITKFDAKSPKIPYYIHRMCLPDGEEMLLDHLQSFGCILKETKKKDDKIKLVTYSRGFEYGGLGDRVLGGIISLNSSDLSFRKWNIFRWLTTSFIISNAGQESGNEFQTEGGDLRIKGLVSLKKKKEELEQMSDAIRSKLPSVFRAPNLDGVLRRDGDEFVAASDCGITTIMDFFNRMKYVMEFDGICFSMSIDDLNVHTYDRQIRSFVKENSVKRWTNFKFFLPSRDETEIDRYVSAVTDIIVNLIDFLGSGGLMPKIWSTNYIHRGVATPSLIIQKLRKRIVENEEIAAMMDLPCDADKSVISDRLWKLLRAIDERRVPMSVADIQKLKKAGRKANVL